MKKFIIYSMLLIISASSFGQQTNPSPALTKQDYLQKSKKQKTLAWCLLGGGTALTVGGIAIATTATVDIITAGEDDNKAVTGVVLICVGIPAMLSSIPFFIASGKNKKRAMSMSFKNESAPQLQKSSFVYRSVPSLSLKISL